MEPEPVAGVAPAAAQTRRLRHDALETLGTKLAVLAFSLAGGVVVARLLGPEGRGQLALALLVPGVLSLLLAGGLGAANTYFLAGRRRDLASLAGDSTGYGLLVSVAGLALGLLLLGSGLMQRWMPGVPSRVVLIALLALPLSIVSAAFAGLLLGLQRIAEVNRLQVAQAALSTTLLVLLVAGMDGGVAAAAMSFVGALLASTLVQVLLLQRLGASFRPRLSHEMGPVLRYAYRGQAGSLLQFFNYRLDVFIVNALAGVEQVGIYGVAVALAELLWHGPDALGFALFPRVAGSLPEEVHRTTRRALRFTLLAGCAGALALAAVGLPVIHLVFGSRFSGAYVPMLLLLPGVVLLGGGKVLTSAIAGSGRPGLNSLNAGAALLVTLGGNLMLVPRFGIAGAAVASSAAYTLSFALALLFYGRLRRD